MTFFSRKNMTHLRGYFIGFEQIYNHSTPSELFLRKVS
jgi:hypothetical protein